ncbi:MAG TPA: alkaline phosphatase family protein [Bryobacteraceae bacterium]|jgi:phospholipase C|nr:alkaline phosphatase family protein [Bryobacteraceae bacterium]
MRKLLSIPVSIFLVLNPAWLSAAEVQSQTPTTPIQHVVVIFDENNSFDHYFGIYPKATNPPGQPRFVALPNTPSVNGFSPGLQTSNPNLNPANGAGAANPFRLNRSQALTADQNHSYGPEEASFDHGLMDLFPKNTGTAGSSSSMSVLVPAVVTTKGLVMGYYDGNTVTALWEYAQNFALNDNSYDTQFGPSSPGAVNLISGQTNGINQSTVVNANSGDEIADGQGGFTLNGDSDPLNDVCAGSTKMQMNFTTANTNIGNLLTNAGLSWGWFQGGFDLTITNPNGSMGCNRSTVSPITGLTEADYVPHHEPFQFYPSTANPTHARPATSTSASIGYPDANANHQYDIHDFFDALSAGNLANVSYLKPASYQNAHPGNSTPLDEQAFIVKVVNAVMQSSFWSTTAIIIAYDDSDGWYDHQMGPIVNASFSTEDSLTGTNACGTSGTTPQLPGPNSGSAPVNGRCGYGVRLPLLVISPWAKANYVDSTLTDQTSVLRFIEDNWNLGRIGGGSFDALANPITNMFNFSNPSGPVPNTNTPILSPTTGLP